MLDLIRDLADRAGLWGRGAFHPDAADGVPALADGGACGTLVLLGFVGGKHWRVFAAAAEATDGQSHPLDRWSRRVIDALAREVGAMAVYPFGGPPWHPFQRWAMRAEPVFASPIGMLVHPRFGLWHSYRGALLLRDRIALPERESANHPCLTCAGRPCMSACPVSAFQPDLYYVAMCDGHLRSDAGGDCRGAGCLARRACPIGPEYRYGPAQSAFYMGAFMSARREERRPSTAAEPIGRARP